MYAIRIVLLVGNEFYGIIPDGKSCAFLLLVEQRYYCYVYLSRTIEYLVSTNVFLTAFGSGKVNIDIVF